ncbi:MAG: trehalase family glycosidase [Anaerolineaceae bacterium]|nr:trehalase family glycosidase [Anaerolineaceae bacterium]
METPTPKTKTPKLTQPNLNMLRNKLDYSQVPFSDRGSRLMVFKTIDKSEFYVKLAERLTNVEPGIETYLTRPPFITQLCLIDENGNELDFEMTSYPHVVYMSTALGDFSLVFREDQGIVFGMPAGVTAGIRFHVSVQLCKILETGGKIVTVRDFFYATNAESVHNEVTPEKGGYTIEFIVKANNDCAISLTIGRDENPFEIPEAFSVYYEAAEKRWQAWFARVPPVIDKYRLSYAYAWWVMAVNLVKPKGHVLFEAMMPSKTNYIGLWLWDSAMHALAFQHTNPELARNQIRAMLALQLPDGMLPDAVYDDGVISEIEHPIRAEVTKPPILAWAAIKLHETDPDITFLEDIYIPLVRWNAWWFSMNDDDVDGLAQYNHPYSSGLDDNPLWDYGMPVESPELNTYLCIQMDALSKIAEIIGLHVEAEMWQRRANAIVNRMIHDFWDEEAGIFYATLKNEPIRVITPFNLYPLWTNRLPKSIESRLLEHLTDPQEFWGAFVLPTVAYNDSHYDPETMWRGPVWANINYFFVEALLNLDQLELAKELRTRTLEMIMENAGMYEFYNSQTGKPSLKAAQVFGWTAAVFIDLAIACSQEEEKQNLTPDLKEETQ